LSSRVAVTDEDLGPRPKPKINTRPKPKTCESRFHDDTLPSTGVTDRTGTGNRNAGKTESGFALVLESPTVTRCLELKMQSVKPRIPPPVWTFYFPVLLAPKSNQFILGTTCTSDKTASINSAWPSRQEQ